MRVRTPRRAAVELERRRPLPDGGDERFASYGMMGLPFTLGHVLAFRRVVASSIGPPYTTAWHRDPEGAWTVYTDVAPERSCARYFGAALSRVVRAEIRLEWAAADRLSLSVPAHRVEWAVRLESTAATRLLSVLLATAPDALLLRRPLLERLGPLAGRLLHGGPLRMAGTTPNGQHFRILPRHVWAATAAAAVVRGRDLGPLGPLPPGQHARLGDLVLPDRGLFSVDASWFRPLPRRRDRDPDRDRIRQPS